MGNQRPLTLLEWGLRYVAFLVELGVSNDDAVNYWCQSILWPNGEDLVALTLDLPELAAVYDIKYLKQERKLLE